MRLERHEYLPDYRCLDCRYKYLYTIEHNTVPWNNRACQESHSTAVDTLTFIDTTGVYVQPRKRLDPSFLGSPMAGPRISSSGKL